MAIVPQGAGGQSAADRPVRPPGTLGRFGDSGSERLSNLSEGTQLVRSRRALFPTTPPAPQNTGGPVPVPGPWGQAAEMVRGSTRLPPQNQGPEASFHSRVFRVHSWQEVPTPTFKGRSSGGRGGGAAGRSGLPPSLRLLRGHSLADADARCRDLRGPSRGSEQRVPVRRSPGHSWPAGSHGLSGCCTRGLVSKAASSNSADLEPELERVGRRMGMRAVEWGARARAGGAGPEAGSAWSPVQGSLLAPPPVFSGDRCPCPR